jgi:hypothetical protein
MEGLGGQASKQAGLSITPQVNPQAPSLNQTLTIVAENCRLHSVVIGGRFHVGG